MHVFDEDLFSVSFPNVSSKMVAKAIEDNQNFGYLCLFLPLPHAISMLITLQANGYTYQRLRGSTVSEVCFEIGFTIE